jgi:hypothetical protein
MSDNFSRQHLKLTEQRRGEPPAMIPFPSLSAFRLGDFPFGLCVRGCLVAGLVVSSEVYNAIGFTVAARTRYAESGAAIDLSLMERQHFAPHRILRLKRELRLQLSLERIARRDHV